MHDSASPFANYRPIDLIREFLALPNEALPGAQFVDLDADAEHTAAWDALRETARTGISLRVTSPCGAIRLCADRPGWRDGVHVF